MTRAQRHMGKVAALGCLLCQHMKLGVSPAEVHHLFDTSERSDWLVAPLCPEHHRGANGFHGLGQRAFERQYKLTETSLLAMTLEALARSA
jgi:hypothetical protein